MWAGLSGSAALGSVISVRHHHTQPTRGLMYPFRKGGSVERQEVGFPYGHIANQNYLIYLLEKGVCGVVRRDQNNLIYRLKAGRVCVVSCGAIEVGCCRCALVLASNFWGTTPHLCPPS